MHGVRRLSVKSRLAVALLHGLAKLPPDWADRTGRTLGRKLDSGKSRAKRTTQTNIELAFPEMPVIERQRLVRASLKDLGEKAARMARVWVLGKNNPDKIQDPDNYEVFTESLAHGHGVMLLVPHLGNWELLGQWVSDHGPLNAMYRPAKLQGIDELVLAGRTSQGYKVHPTNMKGVAGLMKALKRGEMVAVLPDQEPDQAGGEWATFFGQPALTMTLAHRIAQKCPNARVLLASAIKTAHRQYQVVLEPVPESFSRPDGLQVMNDGIEALVRQYPEQYQWEYKRFSTQPDGVSPYR